ncbi:MAG: hypothetical protein QXD03_01790 [Candidatus Anstonellales archaeon]
MKSILLIDDSNYIITTDKHSVATKQEWTIRNTPITLPRVLQLNPKMVRVKVNISDINIKVRRGGIIIQDMYENCSLPLYKINNNKSSNFSFKKLKTFSMVGQNSFILLICKPPSSKILYFNICDDGIITVINSKDDIKSHLIPITKALPELEIGISLWKNMDNVKITSVAFNNLEKGYYKYEDGIITMIGKPK